MFNMSRQVECPGCCRSTCWRGEPDLSDGLFCEHCHEFITTYNDYLHGLIRREVVRLMIKFIDPESDYQLGLLERIFRYEPARFPTISTITM
ncbi:hypothetical protein GCM10027040_27160 [Halomonas shantousis]